MGLRILHELKGIKAITIDTSPFIYYIEAHKSYINILTSIFEAVSKGELTAFTSLITLIEVLTKPIESKDKNLQVRYEELLTNSQNVILCDIDKAIAVESARLRAHYKIKTPDAIQLATGFLNGAGAFITNDSSLKRLKG